MAPGAEPAAASAAAPSPGAAATPPPLATSGATSPTAPAPTAADYTLEPGKSTLYVQVFKSPDTLASGASHDHVVAATGWSGTVRWDPSAPSACKVDIRVPVSGLRPDEDAMRKRVGYEVMLSASQREKIGEQMRAASQLDAARFGDITFAATRCEAVGEQVKVSGSLTVHGVAKTVTSTMKIRGDGQSFSASGTFTAKATDFGFEPYSALLGALKNENEMKFTLDVRGARRP
ncbi:MAG: YceI family protein [Pseudomonadota bacterium]|nr:YceI family protein [Pseudomonadota bacterium]